MNHNVEDLFQYFWILVGQNKIDYSTAFLGRHLFLDVEFDQPEQRPSYCFTILGRQAVGSLVHIMLPHHIEEKLNTKFFPEIFSVVHDQGRDVLDVPDLNMELRPRPDAKVKQNAVIELVE